MTEILYSQNGKLAQCQVDQMSIQQNGQSPNFKLKKMLGWLNSKLTKCQVEKLACWQNAI